jgi:hypothetical protein
MTESQIQEACVKWFRYQYPELKRCLFAIPNGGARTPKGGATLKKEGVLAGVADLFLSKPNQTYHGFYIEMKTPKGTQQPSQKEFEKEAIKQGYKYLVIRSFDDFEKEVKAYLNEV